jgi:predicted HAD superfamily Cof-like phosphohydrolase
MKHKKQLFELFADIAKLNDTAWQNPRYSYDASKAAALVIEEALEKLPLSDKLANQLGCDNNPKSLARCIVNLTTDDNINGTVNENVSEVGAFDSSLDAIYIEVGNMHMQGLSPEQMVEGLDVVHTANQMKAGQKDANGKIVKQDGWEQYAPEQKLQAILAKRIKA